MTDLEHLIENTLICFEKRYDIPEILKHIEEDPNLERAGITVDQCYEICQYVYCTYARCLKEETELRVESKLWKRIEEYDPVWMDWVLVQFKERKSGFMPIPMVAERSRNGKWHGQCDDTPTEEWYLNECCEAVAFMEIPLYEEGEKK